MIILILLMASPVYLKLVVCVCVFVLRPAIRGLLWIFPTA